MDWFKFTNPNSDMKMEAGEFIQEGGVKTKEWVERYRDAGEFTIVADVGSGLKEFLPTGTFISHVDTQEIMVVENHEIPEEPDEDPQITITGRSLEAYVLEQRIVGSNRPFPVGAPIGPFALAEAKTWLQAKALIEFHILGENLENPKDAIPYIDVVSTAYGAGDSEERTVEFGEVYGRVLDILAINDLGLRTLRPSFGNENSTFVIHRGTNRTGSVIFSAEEGDIEDSDYLWSKKSDKNCALVVGRWLSVLVDDVGASGMNRRMMIVDATDIDNDQEVFPTGAALDWIKAAMRARGRRALAAQKPIALQKANTFKESQGAIFGEDYQVGDLVTVAGKYDSRKAMRVAEFVRIDEQDGSKSFPTFIDP